MQAWSNHLKGLKSKADSYLRKKIHLWTVASTYVPKFPAHPSRHSTLQISDSSSWSHRHTNQQNLYQFSMKALTNYYKWVAHSNRNLFSHRSEGWKTKMSTGWHSLQRLEQENLLLFSSSTGGCTHSLACGHITPSSASIVPLSLSLPCLLCVPSQNSCCFSLIRIHLIGYTAHRDNPG